MRRGGCTAAGSRRATTTDQEQESQDTQDTSNYKMCVMPLFLSLAYLHIYASFPDTYESLSNNHCSTWQSQDTHILQKSPLKQITNRKHGSWSVSTLRVTQKGASMVHESGKADYVSHL